MANIHINIVNAMFILKDKKKGEQYKILFPNFYVDIYQRTILLGWIVGSNDIYYSFNDVI